MLGTLFDTANWWTRKNADQFAVITEQEAVTHKELGNWAEQLGAWLIEQGLQKGDRVVVLAQNSLPWVVLSQAVMRVGGVLAPVNFRSTASEVQYFFDHYEPRFIFADKERYAIAEESVTGRGGITLVALEDQVDSCRHSNIGVEVVQVEEDDYLVIIPTSGSTGRPKGVVYSHRSLMEYILEFALAEPQVVASAKILLFAPLSTSAGYNLLTKFLAYGGTVYIYDSFDPQKALTRILEDRVSVLMGVPLFFESISALPEFKDADLSHLIMALVGGAPVSRELLATWKARGCVLRQLYGQTEVGGQATYNAIEYAEDFPEKCGYGLPFKRIAVIDDQGEFCSPNTIGQIVVRGPGVMVKYWQDEVATNKTLVNGWVRTGDLGTIDENGLLQMVDRLKDIIISGGLNISAAEIERVVMEFDAVREVACIGIKDDKFGETPMVILYAEKPIDIDSLITHCDKELSNFKVPRYVVVESEPLPRLASGKISKPQLRERYKDAHQVLTKVR